MIQDFRAERANLPGTQDPAFGYALWAAQTARGLCRQSTTKGMNPPVQFGTIEERVTKNVHFTLREVIELSRWFQYGIRSVEVSVVATRKKHQVLPMAARNVPWGSLIRSTYTLALTCGSNTTTELSVIKP